MRARDNCLSLSVYDWQTLKWQINYWNRRNLSCPTTSTTAMAVGFPCPFSLSFSFPTPVQHFVATVVWLAQWLPQRSTRVAKLQSKLLLELGNIEEIRIWICRLLDSIPSSEFAVRSSQLPFASSTSNCEQQQRQQRFLLKEMLGRLITCEGA